MKCVLPTCTRNADYIFSGMSLCEEHLVQFQRNMIGNEALAPVLNQPKPTKEELQTMTNELIEDAQFEPISPAKKKASQYLADYKQWKGRKKPGGGYHLADGTWGWDFADQFPPDIVSLILNEPVVVGDYVFEANETGTTITKRKA